MINAVCGIRSTGRICTDIAKDLEKQGYEVKIAYGRETVPEQYQKYAVRIGNNVDVYWHALMTRLFDDRGYWSRIATKKFLKWAEEYDPDLLWLHNLHDYFINIDMLFDWIKSRPQMEVKWTQHDCWAFTGHCSYFTMVKCEQWKTHCSYCPKKTPFPHDSLFNQCQRNFDRKKKAFTGVKNMTLISPSQWLADLIKESFLREYPVQVVHNTIDTNIFKPTPSDFRKQYGVEDKKIVLGVASAWTKRKGLDDFIRLSEMLDDTYAIVLVGLTDKQIKKLPKKIIGIKRTNNIEELAGLYTTADVFVNPSREETFGMTTIEAQACGTPAIVYKDTACEEVVKNYGGLAVEQDFGSLHATIIRKLSGGGVIVLIPRTNSATELAEIYTASDVFVNPTYEDNYPTVNLEARACGTPVITYDTGGSPESAGSNAVVVDTGDVTTLYENVCNI